MTIDSLSEPIEREIRDTGRILVIDDNPAIHEDFKKILGHVQVEDRLQDSENSLFGVDESEPPSGQKKFYFELAHAYQGEEGLQLCQNGLNYNAPFDVAMVDMRMPPGIDGLETIEKLWKIDPNLQVVLCTAFSDYSWCEIVERLDAADNFLILKKPFDVVEVSQIAASLTKKRALMYEHERLTDALQMKFWKQRYNTQRAHEETIHRLVSASLYRDTETGTHIQRVGRYSGLLAKLAGFSARYVDLIQMAAPMHDVGKIGIPDEILLKPSRFTPAERKIMEQHTIIGFELLESSDSAMLQMASEIALNHHENWDGSGYPNGLKGTAIPECARIVSIVDVFDALSQDRVYRPAFPQDQVIKMIRDDIGKKFDPKLGKLFIDNLDQFMNVAEELVEEVDVF